MSNSVTTVRLAGERKRIVERMALEAGSKCGKILRVSDVVHFLIDRRTRQKEHPRKELFF